MGAAQIVVHLSASDGWTHAAAILTGIAAAATGVLAWFTWRLARETKDVAKTTRDEAIAVTEQVKVANRQAEIATQQAELSRVAMRASIRPWIAPALAGPRTNIIGLRETAERITGEVPIRNIGPGIAVINREQSYVLGHSGLGTDLTPYTNLRVDVPALPPTEGAWLVFSIPKVSAQWSVLTETAFCGGEGMVGDYALDVTYTDWSGEQPTRVRFHIGRADTQSPWTVFRSEYFDSETDELITRAESLVS